MIRKKLTNLPLETSSNEGNPISHYWPKKSEQDAVRGDFFGDHNYKNQFLRCYDIHFCIQIYIELNIFRLDEN